MSDANQKTTTNKKSSKHTLDESPSPNDERPKRAKTDNGERTVLENDNCLDTDNDTSNVDSHKSSQHIAQSEALLKKEDYDGAMKEANTILNDLPPLSNIAKAHLLRGKALLNAALDKMSETGEQTSDEAFAEIRDAFNLADRLNPEDEEIQEEQSKLSAFLSELPVPDVPEYSKDTNFDVIVVGAGCAGVGTALMLTKTFGLDNDRVLLVERGDDVGESFRRWPAEMRFISPSFNQQGWTDSFDLNSISHGTSPAFSLHSEHPSGVEYASYLSAIAKTNELQIRKGTEVEAIRPMGESDGIPLFNVDVRAVKQEGGDGTEAVTETLSARYIIWAAGEFQYPKAFNPSHSSTKTITEDPNEEKKDENINENDSESFDLIPGAEFCLHNSQVKSWAKLDGNDYIIIGGYESGVDACVNLARAGKRCQVLASTPCWDVKEDDPSTELAPYTAMRLREVSADGFAPKPKLLAPLRVVSVQKAKNGGFDVTAEWQKVEEVEDAPLREPHKVAALDGDTKPGEEGTTIILHTPNAPILATGFEGSVSAKASHLFAFAQDDDVKKGCLGSAPFLTQDDESTKIPGVFLVGPQVQHDALSFCFVYKFRQRFAVVANAICKGLGLDTSAATGECHENNMYLDSFETCGDKCGEVC